MSYVRIFILGFILDLLSFTLLMRMVALGVAKASLISISLAGLVMLICFAPKPQRKDAVGLALCLLWIAVWALLGARLLAIVTASSADLLIAKLLMGAAFAALTVLVFGRLTSGAALGRGSWIAGFGLGAFSLAALAFWQPSLAAPDDGSGLREAYANKRAPIDGSMRVFHLGHSLVGRDMPAMLDQLAGSDHDYSLQLGWGTSLREHFEPDLTINGFAEENDTPHYRNAHEALASGEYDAFVMTEMVTLTDAIRYHDSSSYAAKWAAEAASQNPDMAIFLYETWHGLDQQPEWLDRLPKDLELWTSRLLWPATRAAGRPVYLIPAGQVMARLVHTIDSRPNGLAELRSRQDLFALTPEGTQDNIHLNDLGAYLIALTHYAVIYGKTPVGLPHQLRRADGSLATAPSAELALEMQKIVWQVIRDLDLTGI